MKKMILMLKKLLQEMHDLQLRNRKHGVYNVIIVNDIFNVDEYTLFSTRSSDLRRCNSKSRCL